MSELLTFFTIRFRKEFVIGLLTFMLLNVSALSSYSPAIQNEVETSRVINGNFDDVWSKLINWFATRGIRIETVEKASGLIQVQTKADNLNLNEYPVANCGTIDGKNLPYKPDLRFNVVVTKIDDKKVKVDVNLFLEKWKEPDKYNQKTLYNVSCYSSGYLENSILNAISDEKIPYQPPQVTSYSSETGIAKRSFWFLGAGTIAMNSTDFYDVHISDWQNYGTGSAEGRVALEISEAEAGSFPIMFSVGGGSYVDGTDNIIMLEIFYALGSSSYTALGVGGGYDYALSTSDKFRLGVLAKGNVTLQTIDFGKVKMLPDKKAPVITRKGTFYEGDEIEASQLGIGLQGLLTARYNFTKKFGLQLNLGYMFSFNLGDMEIEVKRPGSDSKKDKLIIDFEDKSVVEPMLGSTKNPGFIPKATTTGLNAYLTFVFHLN